MFAIVHKIGTGHNFDGAVPDTVPVTTYGVKVYPEDTVTFHAGLFEFTGSERRPIKVIGIQVKFGGQDDWALVIVDPVTGDIPLASGTTETNYIRVDQDAFTLLPGQKLKLTTTGTISAAMQASVMFAPAALGEV